jgi:hypothetical protein
MMASNSCFHSLHYVMGWKEFLFKCVQSRAIVRQRFLITLISNQGINVITEHTCRIQNESECNVKKSPYSYYPKTAMSTMKDAAKYRKSWNVFRSVRTPQVVY